MQVTSAVAKTYVVERSVDTIFFAFIRTNADGSVGSVFAFAAATAQTMAFTLSPAP